MQYCEACSRGRSSTRCRCTRAARSRTPSSSRCGADGSFCTSSKPERKVHAGCYLIRLSGFSTSWPLKRDPGVSARLRCGFYPSFAEQRCRRKAPPCQASLAVEKHVDRPQHQTRSVRERPRALGAALEIALYLARGSAGTGKPANPVHEMTTPKGRVLVITTGPTTKVRCEQQSSRTLTHGSYAVVLTVPVVACLASATYGSTGGRHAFCRSQGPGFVPLNVIDGDEQPEDAYAEEEARRSVLLTYPVCCPRR